MSSSIPKMPEGHKMEYRFLGNSGLQVSALSLGAWITQGSTQEDDIAEQCMLTAYGAGVNFFDNAETYGDKGSAEITMGKILKKNQETMPREELVISTKIYWSPTASGPNSSGVSRKRIVEGLNASLKRLQLDYVDVVFAHRPDPYTPMEEIVRGFNHVIDQGKAFYWGTSEWEYSDLIEAHLIAEKLGLIAPITEQPQYNLFERKKLERDYLPLFKKYSFGTTIWSPLASGLLTGKYNNGIPDGSRLSHEKYDWLKKMVLADETRLPRVAKLEPFAKELGCTQAQLALAWCLRNKNVSTVITGASRPEQVIENMKALELYPKITDKMADDIDAIMESKPGPRKTMRRGDLD